MKVTDGTEKERRDLKYESDSNQQYFLGRREKGVMSQGMQDPSRAGLTLS